MAVVRHAVVVLLLLSVARLGECQTSFLERFPLRATDAVGTSVLRMFARISAFDAEQVASGELDPIGEGGELPGGATVEAATFSTIDRNPRSSTPTSAFIVLHGMGMDPEDITILADVARLRMPRTRFVFVRAPKAYVDYLKKETQSWFNIKTRRPGGSYPNELRAAAAGVGNIVRAQKKLGIPSEKCIVLGMSQGGAVALTVYLAEPIKLAGVIGVATFLPLPSQWKRGALPAENADTPLFMQHGDKDTAISLAEAKASARRLRALGRKVTFREYKGAGHQMFERATVVFPDIIRQANAMLGA